MGARKATMLEWGARPERLQLPSSAAKQLLSDMRSCSVQRLQVPHSHTTMQLLNDGITLTQAVSADTDQMVAVHLRSFPGFFLTFLGRPFLRELYAATMVDPSGIAYVVTDGEQHLGFVTGTTQPSGFYRRLLQKRWWRFAYAAIPAVLRRPGIVPRLLRAFSTPSATSSEPGRTTLMSIAVAPEAQGRGVGRALVEAFVGEAARRGATQIDLTTDRDNNDAVNRFYRNLGFVCRRSYTTPEGRSMNEYVIACGALNREASQTQ